MQVKALPKSMKKQFKKTTILDNVLYNSMKEDAPRILKLVAVNNPAMTRFIIKDEVKNSKRSVTDVGIDIMRQALEFSLALAVGNEDKETQDEIECFIDDFEKTITFAGDADELRNLVRRASNFEAPYSRPLTILSSTIKSSTKASLISKFFCAFKVFNISCG